MHTLVEQRFHFRPLLLFSLPGPWLPVAGPHAARPDTGIQFILFSPLSILHPYCGVARERHGGSGRRAAHVTTVSGDVSSNARLVPALTWRGGAFFHIVCVGCCRCCCRCCCCCCCCCCSCLCCSHRHCHVVGRVRGLRPTPEWKGFKPFAWSSTAQYFQLKLLVVFWFGGGRGGGGGGGGEQKTPSSFFFLQLQRRQKPVAVLFRD